MQGVDYINNDKKQDYTHKSAFHSYKQTLGYNDLCLGLLKNKPELILLNQVNTPHQIDYRYQNELIGKLPNKLGYLLLSFKESEYILYLEDDWDDNRSEKYSFETWRSAIQFVIDYAKTLSLDFNTHIDKPKIYHGPSGSIDILWEYDTYTLLVNVNKNCVDVTFYADNTINTQSVRGEFKLPNYKKSLLPFAIQF